MASANDIIHIRVSKITLHTLLLKSTLVDRGEVILHFVQCLHHIRHSSHHVHPLVILPICPSLSTVEQFKTGVNKQHSNLWAQLSEPPRQIQNWIVRHKLNDCNNHHRHGCTNSNCPGKLLSSPKILTSDERRNWRVLQPSSSPEFRHGAGLYFNGASGCSFLVFLIWIYQSDFYGQPLERRHERLVAQCRREGNNFPDQESLAKIAWSGDWRA